MRFKVGDRVIAVCDASFGKNYNYGDEGTVVSMVRSEGSICPMVMWDRTGEKFAPFIKNIRRIEYEEEMNEFKVGDEVTFKRPVNRFWHNARGVVMSIDPIKVYFPSKNKHLYLPSQDLKKIKEKEMTKIDRVEKLEKELSELKEQIKKESRLKYNSEKIYIVDGIFGSYILIKMNGQYAWKDLTCASGGLCGNKSSAEEAFNFCYENGYTIKEFTDRREALEYLMEE